MLDSCSSQAYRAACSCYLWDVQDSEHEIMHKKWLRLSHKTHTVVTSVARRLGLFLPSDLDAEPTRRYRGLAPRG
jgi:hypothetical protein